MLRPPTAPLFIEGAAPVFFKDLGLSPSFVIQPIFSIAAFHLKGEPSFLALDGGEILLRLNDITTNTLNPYIQLDRFFLYAAAEGKLPEVDIYAIRAAFSLIQQHWTDLNPNHQRPLKLNVNITPQTLLCSRSLSSLHALVEKNPQGVSNLCLELVESYDLSEISTIASALKTLQEKGVSIAFDDVGAGHMDISVLGKASQAGAHYIKVDRRLIAQIETNSEKVEEVLGLAKQMKVSALAEGVETIEAYKAVLKMGFHYAQGWWLEKELSTTDFFDLVHYAGSSTLLRIHP